VRERGGEFVYLGWPVYSSPHEDDRVVRDISSLLKSTHEFIFVQLSRVDGVGHVYGPDSEELKQALRRMDADFAEILKVLKETLTQFSLFVFGDHGMVKVKKHLPLFAHLKALKIRPGKEYLAFLDSTTVRFWFFDERARGEVLSLLRGLEGGRVLETDDLARHHIRFKGRSYGDIIFLVSPGYVIHPSFFSRGVAPKGMHGYDPDFQDNQGIFVMAQTRAAGASVPEVVDHVDLYATAVNLLGHNLPPQAHGRNLLAESG
jgi:predicted AlkP superfamily pyrophosphatase or phosphodiesterase